MGCQMIHEWLRWRPRLLFCYVVWVFFVSFSACLYGFLRFAFLDLQEPTLSLRLCSPDTRLTFFFIGLSFY